MIILGIDPGSRITGYGVIDFKGSVLHHIASGSIKIEKTNAPQQLKEIFLGISSVMTSFNPEEAAIEQVFVKINANSALKLGQARGAALVALAQTNIWIAEYSARQVKQAVVGYGAAEKDQVQKMVKILLKLEKLPQTDAADALAIAICHAHMRRTLLLRAKEII
jgi:crossover junction endodeoxyribonuclease RuvC